MENNNGAMAYQEAPAKEVQQEQAKITTESEKSKVEYTGKRVDFTNEDSITTYGEEIINKISATIDATSQMESASVQKPVFLTEKDLGLISSFDETLKKETEKKEKVQSNGIFQSILKAIKKVDPEVEEKEAKKSSYQAKYGYYCENLDKICGKLDDMIVNSNADNQLRQQSAAKLIPTIDQLEAAIRVGHEDLEAYTKESERLMDEYTANPGKQEILAELKLRQARSILFNKTLAFLEQDLDAYKSQLNAYALQQVEEYEIIQLANNFKKHSIPVLKGQGSAMVLSEFQAERIKLLQNLNNEAADAIMNNAKALDVNIQKIQELEENEKYDEALKELHDVLGNGFEVYQRLQEKQQQMYESRHRLYDELNRNQEEYQKMARSILIPDEALEAYNNGETQTIQTPNQFVKRN